MEELKKKFSWIKEKFERGKIRVNLEHSCYAKNLFESNDVDRKFEYFLELFMASLLASQRIDIDRYTAVGQECSECGKLVVYEYDIENCEILDYTRNSKTNKLERGCCTFVDDYSFEIDIPTGEILCCDRLPFYDMLQRLDNTKHTLNSNLGLKERTLSYATENIFHVFVGNSCPDVFKKDNTLYIGHSSDNECGECSCGREECDCEYEEYPPIEGAEQIADICTDLWWASIVDISIYKKLLIDYYGEEQAKTYMKEITPIETKIKPGVYRGYVKRQNSHDDYYNHPSVLTYLHWIRNI